MPFDEELDQVLPMDLPERGQVIEKGARHLKLIVETNRQFNLTRIVSPREAAIKHVLDSLLPWRLFRGANRVLDAGTGAGFPGIPLALALPATRFTLTDSTQKKARFVEQAVQDLEIRNADVSASRAEDCLADKRVDIVTARAVAPLTRAIPLFLHAVKSGARVLLYKGPDVEQEIAEAAQDAVKRKVRIEIAMRYELPEGQGSRTVVELSRMR